MMALQIVASIVGYLVVGGCTAGHASSTYEEHGPNCNGCAWELWGAFWPIYWAGQLCLVMPYRRTKRLLADRKLPKARLLKEGETDGLG